MLRKSREEILKDFKAQVAQGKILVGVGAGTGITAKCSEKADVDMLIIYNSGRFTTLDVSEWQEEVLYQEFFLTVMPMPSFRKWDRKYFLS